MNWHIIKEVAIALAIGVALFVLAQATLQAAPVEGPSMEPLLHTNEELVINKAAYLHLKASDIYWLPRWLQNMSGDKSFDIFAGPQRGDLVVFHSPQDPTRLFIKRVVALPGETVRIEGGKVYINDSPLAEPYVQEPPAYRLNPSTMPEQYYYLLGDNRNNSDDSYTFGPIPLDSIVGRAELRIWPFDPAHMLIADQ